MRTMKSVQAVRQDASATESDPESVEAFDTETYEIFRVNCPDCGQPIALLAEEEKLPEHALCATPWNPFGPTVCQGSGRPVEDAPAPGAEDETRERDVTELLTLPAGLDWRTQPFSHVGGPGSQPIRAPRQGQPRHLG